MTKKKPAAPAVPPAPPVPPPPPDPKSSTERARDLRERRTSLGLTEVRNIWANPADHAALKAAAEKLMLKLAREREGKPKAAAKKVRK